MSEHDFIVMKFPLSMSAPFLLSRKKNCKICSELIIRATVRKHKDNTIVQLKMLK